MLSAYFTFIPLWIYVCVGERLCELTQDASWHAQNTVQGKFALRQPHLNEPQGGSLAQPHLMRDITEAGASETVSGTIIGTNVLFSSSLVHP